MVIFLGFITTVVVFGLAGVIVYIVTKGEL
jgi:hypothetical protein